MNKPLSEKAEYIDEIVEPDFIVSKMVYLEADVKQAIEEAYEEVMIFCPRVTAIKQIFKDKFGFDLE